MGAYFFAIPEARIPIRKGRRGTTSTNLFLNGLGAGDRRDWPSLPIRYDAKTCEIVIDDCRIKGYDELLKFLAHLAALGAWPSGTHVKVTVEGEDGERIAIEATIRDGVTAEQVTRPRRRRRMSP